MKIKVIRKTRHVHSPQSKDGIGPALVTAEFVTPLELAVQMATWPGFAVTPRTATPTDVTSAHKQRTEHPSYMAYCGLATATYPTWETFLTWCEGVLGVSTEESVKAIESHKETRILGGGQHVPYVNTHDIRDVLDAITPADEVTPAEMQLAHIMIRQMSIVRCAGYQCLATDVGKAFEGIPLTERQGLGRHVATWSNHQQACHLYRNWEDHGYRPPYFD